jgi:predicted exporter
MRPARILGRTLAAVLAVSVVLAVATTWERGWNVRTSLMDLLPHGNGRMREVLGLVEGRTGRELTIVVGHRDAATAQSLAEGLRAALESTGTLEAADDRASAGMEKAWWNLVREHLPRMLTDSLELAADRRDTALLERQILSSLYLPWSVLSPREDPFQIASTRLSGMSRPGWSLCGRRPCKTESDTTWVLVRTRLKGGAFDADVQERLLPVIDRARARVVASGGTVLCQGVVLHAAYGRRQTQADMNLVGIGSAAGILLILWGAFRSPLPFFAGVGTVLVGLFSGAVLTHALFGGIHAMTLAFGASITGLCTDYALFLLVRRAFERDRWEPRDVISVHWSTLWLALATTLLSFAGLAASGFPGLVEIAVFSLTGLTTSWLMALVGLPFLFRRPALRTPETLRFLAKSNVAASSPRLRWAAAILALACAMGVLWLRGDDDVRRLQKPSADLVAQDAEVTSILGTGSGQILLVEGSTPESLMVRLERLDSLLAIERSQGRVKDWLSVSRSLPSRRRQVQDSLRLEALLSGALRRVPERLGMEPQALDDFAKRSRAGVPPLRLREWMNSDASWGSRDLVVDTSPWRAAVSVDAVEGWKLSAPNEWLVRVDAAGLYTSLLKGQTRRSAWIVGFMYLLVLVGLRVFLGWRRAISVLAPPVLAAVATLGFLGWAGIELHFFGLMALALVLGAGVDYTLFLESRASEDDAGYATVVLCAATALLSFGVLGFASSPALSQFGLVTAVGLFWSLVLSPWAPRLSRGEAR